MTQMVTSLLGRRARPRGSVPAAAETLPSDYWLEVVVVWLDGGFVWTWCVDVRDGVPAKRQVFELEFEPEL